MRSKAELKRIAHEALKAEYGFAPAMNSIILLEASGDGTYIRFMINNHEYRFDSAIYDGYGSVWCGAGTITKEA